MNLIKEDFFVFVYDKGPYYISNEIRKIIKQKMGM